MEVNISFQHTIKDTLAFRMNILSSSTKLIDLIASLDTLDCKAELKQKTCPQGFNVGCCSLYKLHRGNYLPVFIIQGRLGR